jgi:hypothetical protein
VHTVTATCVTCAACCLILILRNWNSDIAKPLKWNKNSVYSRNPQSGFPYNEFVPNRMGQDLQLFVGLSTPGVQSERLKSRKYLKKTFLSLLYNMY